MRIKRTTGSTPGLALSGNNLWQVVHTRVPLSPSSIIWYRSRAVMPCGWEGNRRSGVAVAMRHRLQWFIHLRAHCLHLHGTRSFNSHPEEEKTHYEVEGDTRLKVTALSVKLAGGIEISEGLGRGLNASSQDDEFKAVSRLRAPLPQSVSQYRLVTLAYVFQYCFILLLFIIHI